MNRDPVPTYHHGAPSIGPARSFRAELPVDVSLTSCTYDHLCGQTRPDFIKKTGSKYDDRSAMMQLVRSELWWRSCGFVPSAVLSTATIPRRTVHVTPNPWPRFKHTRSKRYPLLGKVIDDRYHLIGGLGQGGLGTVYLAEHRHLEQFSR